MRELGFGLKMRVILIYFLFENMKIKKMVGCLEKWNGSKDVNKMVKHAVALHDVGKMTPLHL